MAALFRNDLIIFISIDATKEVHISNASADPMGLLSTREHFITALLPHSIHGDTRQEYSINTLSVKIIGTRFKNDI